jgi:hypothetical protein
MGETFLNQVAVPLKYLTPRSELRNRQPSGKGDDETVDTSSLKDAAGRTADEAIEARRARQTEEHPSLWEKRRSTAH